MIIFATRGQRMKLIINGKYIAKKLNFKNFEQNLCYVPQKRTCRNQIQVEKV